MNIGILGSGTVGQTLGTGLIRHDHTVHLGSRSPEREDLSMWATKTGGQVGSYAEAAAFGELLILATAWEDTAEAITQAGPERFTGKVVLDATNPLDFPDDAPPVLAVGGTDSAGERFQTQLPDAHLVKCFAMVGAGLMVDPDLPDGPPTMFIAGNSIEAKQQTTALLDTIGWDTVDLGGIEAARYIEAMAMVWVLYAMREGSRTHALKLLRD
ncbi:MAG: NAD(P)-binding domain-containing protein [Rhodothermales bacterium]|nr:NAD(P)-binding domain-containing protein [Rhodothermales bacterium]